ncbi:hypothetical protein FHR23_001641 [Stakelama sediminis]|uniref:Lipoprotein n=1 Tax=Stakelama sediminis TaxID=463200 RepID=A0A840YYG8_9SPHN|nr:hypothetical protein [Stakelama sediminis]
MNRLLKWTIFGILCLLSWACAVFFLLTTGWASCSVTGHCVMDRLVIGGILLLLPAQVAVAVYLRQREKSAKESDLVTKAR